MQNQASNMQGKLELTGSGNLREKFERSGLRLTPQREQVLSLFNEKLDHPTAEQVFLTAKETMPEISMATVYNCLEKFVECELLRLVQLDRGATRYCPNMHDHSHYYCENCGEVFDVDFDRIIFSPEFLREGSALKDNLYPSRIIVGSQSEKGIQFANMLKGLSLKKDVKVILTNSSEAESIKLFSNTYLAMRVSFFNELDTFCYLNNLDAKNVINGVSSDARIGDYYNNPSFGYGGYCLPKDTKQLLANYKEVPQEMMRAIVKSNETRITFLANEIVGRVKSDLGVYRLSMKSGSDNYRSSSIIKVIEKIHEISPSVAIKIYEPSIKSNSFMHCEVVDDLNNFKKKSDLIITNRLDKELNDVKEKVFTRDIFHNN